MPIACANRTCFQFVVLLAIGAVSGQQAGRGSKSLLNTFPFDNQPQARLLPSQQLAESR